MNEASSEHAGGAPGPPQADDTQQTDVEPEPAPPTSMEPLTDEQIALYRARMESGFYRTDEIRREVAERLCGEVILDKRRR